MMFEIVDILAQELAHYFGGDILGLPLIRASSLAQHTQSLPVGVEKSLLNSRILPFQTRKYGFRI
jgi:hypothetical protein